MPNRNSCGAPAELTRQRERGVRDTQGKSWWFSFFGVIILTYIYVRIGGASCLTPLTPWNSNALVS